MGLAAACDRPAEEPTEPVVEFGRGTVQIATASDTVTLDVEIAETDQQRRIGLMGRPSLAPDAGMIFLFESEQPPEAVFWMFNTLIPLSIAFISEQGRIGNIVDMEPCDSPYPQWCPNYPAGVPYRSALEVNRGYFARHGISIGDQVILRR